MTSHRPRPGSPGRSAGGLPGAALLIIVGVLLWTLSFACAPLGSGSVARAADASPALKVIVPVAPYAYVVDRVARGRVDVLVLVPVGQSPHTYSPTPQQIAELAGADVLFRTDLALEEPLAVRLLALDPALRIVRLTAESDHADGGGHDGHGHGEHEHGEHGHDPHVWLDPTGLLLQAATIVESLTALDPGGAATYAAGLDSLTRDIERLDAELKDRLGEYAGRRFYVHHPAFGHFAESYGLVQVAIEHEGKEPSARRLAGLIDEATADGISAVLIQPQHASPAAATFAEEIGATLVTVDPLAFDLPATFRSLADAVVHSWEPAAE